MLERYPSLAFAKKKMPKSLMVRKKSHTFSYFLIGLRQTVGDYNNPTPGLCG
jgi:hypothetical protein